MWIILNILDILLFVIVALTVTYILFYSFSSNRYQRIDTGIIRKKGRFLIVTTCTTYDLNIDETIKSLLKVDYETKDYDIVVVGNKLTPLQSIKLAQYPIHLIRMQDDNFNRNRAHQYVIQNFQNMKIYDQIIFIDPNETVSADFLYEVNKVLQSGIRFFQLHCRTIQNPTSASVISSTMGEINNSIFRKGHVAVGLPSALSPSGLVIDYDWYKRNSQNIDSEDEVKSLEAMLLKEKIFVDYIDEICLYSRPVSKSAEIVRKRKRWVKNQIPTFFSNLKKLLPAILNWNMSLSDKIFQWIMVPRMIMMGIIIVMSILLPFIYFTMVLKWWALFLIVTFAFALATPDYIVDSNWTKSMLLLPVLIFQSAYNLVLNNGIAKKIFKKKSKAPSI